MKAVIICISDIVQTNDTHFHPIDTFTIVLIEGLVRVTNACGHYVDIPNVMNYKRNVGGMVQQNSFILQVADEKIGL